MIVILNVGSSTALNGVVWPDVSGVADLEVIGVVCVESNEAGVKVQRPNAQLRMYLDRVFGTRVTSDSVALFSVEDLDRKSVV